MARPTATRRFHFPGETPRADGSFSGEPIRPPGPSPVGIGYSGYPPSSDPGGGERGQAIGNSPGVPGTMGLFDGPGWERDYLDPPDVYDAPPPGQRGRRDAR